MSRAVRLWECKAFKSFLFRKTKYFTNSRLLDSATECKSVFLSLIVSFRSKFSSLIMYCTISRCPNSNALNITLLFELLSCISIMFKLNKYLTMLPDSHVK
ncbi:hypothetical protein M9Y10_036823 [Tritrichomonas musculus]|uniref:Uncharacterized protein n=1 Tax=Tritrichomonas musculus TaxID=1915356 RepID=A0ABR2GTW9_9EUKA